MRALGDELARRAEALVGRPALGRPRQVCGDVREVQPALRRADHLHGLHPGDGDRERARRRHPDLLRSGDDEPAGDELGRLAAGFHPRQPVQRRVGVRAADGLDEGRDDRVMLVGALVVGDRALVRPPSRSVARSIDPAVRCQLGRALDRAQESPRVAVGDQQEVLERRLVELVGRPAGRRPGCRRRARRRSGPGEPARRGPRPGGAGRRGPATARRALG